MLVPLSISGNDTNDLGAKPGNVFLCILSRGFYVMTASPRRGQDLLFLFLYFYLLPLKFFGLPLASPRSCCTDPSS